MSEDEICEDCGGVIGHDVDCPYCGAGCEIDKEDEFFPDIKYSLECKECGCWFSFAPVITVVFQSSKSPCLNGGHHEFTNQSLPTEEGMYEFVACKYCGVDEYPQRLDA